MFRIKAWCLFFKSPSVPNRSVCCIEWKKARSSRCCAVFGHFLYCFASFDSRDFKFSATRDRKGPGCVAEFCAMGGRKTREERKIRLFGFPDVLVTRSATTATRKTVSSLTLTGPLKYLLLSSPFKRVPQGFLGNKGTREFWQWEHGNKAEKIVENKGTSNRLGNRGTNPQNYKALHFLHKYGGDRRFSAVFWFLWQVFVPIFRVYSSLALAVKSFFSDRCRPLV